MTQFLGGTKRWILKKILFTSKTLDILQKKFFTFFVVKKQRKSKKI